MLDRLELQHRAGERNGLCPLTVGASQFNVLGENSPGEELGCIVVRW